jgi:hypothetical protein
MRSTLNAWIVNYHLPAKKGVMQKSFAWALGLFAVLTAVSVATSWVRDQFVPDFKTIARSEAEDTLRQRVTISATPESTEAAQLEHRIEELTKRLESIEKKK